MQPARSAWEADRLPLHHTRRAAPRPQSFNSSWSVSSGGAHGASADTSNSPEPTQVIYIDKVDPLAQPDVSDQEIAYIEVFQPEIAEHDDIGAAKLYMDVISHLNGFADHGLD